MAFSTFKGSRVQVWEIMNAEVVFKRAQNIIFESMCFKDRPGGITLQKVAIPPFSHL